VVYGYVSKVDFDGNAARQRLYRSAFTKAELKANPTYDPNGVQDLARERISRPDPEDRNGVNITSRRDGAVVQAYVCPFQGE